MTFHRAILAVVLANVFLALPAWAQEPPVAEMKKRADDVLRMSNNIEARQYVEDVMMLADRYAKDGNLAEAIRYYEAGLKLFPLDLKRQLACAEVFVKLGKKEEALTKAKIVSKAAEEDALIIPARKMLGEKVDTGIEALARMDANVPTIILVPLGDTDILLLRDTREKAQAQLGIPVQIRSVVFTMPAFGRDPFHDFCAQLRKFFTKEKESDPKAFTTMLKKDGVQESDLEKDEVVFGYYVKLVERSTEKDAKANRAKVLQSVSSLEKQWDANQLLVDFHKATAAYSSDKVKLIGITSKDLYSEDLGFQFALTTMGQASVMSYRRFMATMTHETPSRERLLKRTVNQVLSCAGRVFGIDACTDPTCPRAYPHSVAEQDAKGDKLCDDCRKAFDKAFGRVSAPTSTPATPRPR